MTLHAFLYFYSPNHNEGFFTIYNNHILAIIMVLWNIYSTGMASSKFKVASLQLEFIQYKPMSVVNGIED